ncbi:MAG: UDP-N-acetylmuramoyl-tripeptide--D-alanyl-D-alanine ligase [Planctomycetes bacterium]|nr:UDP-N-acetylmuramoyl-tripeptide--D-alanyl-D-alanine ligase [Planctomycetota bacterium]
MRLAMNTVHELHKAIGGTVHPEDSDRAKRVHLGRVVTDSREVQRGDVFWALVGPNHDGADFVEEALERGAAGVVAGRAVDVPSDCWTLIVDDALKALHQWAKTRRSQFTGTVIAVTGSVGKTTTREMIRAVLKTRLTGAASPRNYNNHVGVPLSMLNMELDHDYVVLEIGASRRGEIAAMAALCSPTIGVITSVADAHLGGFGSRQAIAEAKSELLAALPPDGHAVLANDPWLRRLAQRYRVPVTWTGRGPDCHVTASDVHWSQGKLEFRVGDCPFRVPVWGRHHVNSVLIAVAVGRMMGFELDEIAAALETFDPVPMRCEVREVRGATIINDTYNASPAAMRAALDLLRDFEAHGRRIFVAGDMGQLGEESVVLHRRLGQEVVTHSGADLLIACGDHSGDVVGGARAAGMPWDSSVACDRPEEAVPHLTQTILPGDVVLVKGSRKMGMERVVEAIERCASEKAA